MSVGTIDALASRPSRHSVDETLKRLTGLIQAAGAKVFALVDHSGEAAKVGMTMRPTKLVIFGNPRAGTPLMIASPSIAIDLPLKILVWEDADRAVWLSYDSPDYLQARHHLPQELRQTVAIVENLAVRAGE